MNHDFTTTQMVGNVTESEGTHNGHNTIHN